MTLLLQVSDPHFGTERQEVVDALVALAAARRPDALAVVCPGISPNPIHGRQVTNP